MILTFESQGNSFFQGVRFSVQTSSLGKAACRNSEEFVPVTDATTPSLLNDSSGLVVVLLSIKFKEAQNWPDKACVKPDHCSSTLEKKIYNNEYRDQTGK